MAFVIASRALLKNGPSGAIPSRDGGRCSLKAADRSDQAHLALGKGGNGMPSGHDSSSLVIKQLISLSDPTVEDALI